MLCLGGLLDQVGSLGWSSRSLRVFLTAMRVRNGTCIVKSIPQEYHMPRTGKRKGTTAITPIIWLLESIGLATVK